MTLAGLVAGGQQDVNLKPDVAVFQDADGPAEAAGGRGELRGERHGRFTQRRQSQRSLGQDDAEQERWVLRNTHAQTDMHTHTQTQNIVLSLEAK